VTNEEVAKELHAAIEKDVRMYGRVSLVVVTSAIRKMANVKDLEISKLKNELSIARRDNEMLEMKIDRLKEDISNGRNELSMMRERVFELKELLRSALGHVQGVLADRISREIFTNSPLPKKLEDP
jgi:anti-sigma28 factor (negative regulator of flagellin synthesis)